MLNEVANELSVCRSERISNTPRHVVTELIHQCLGSSSYGLQGIDAESDGMTMLLWEQAVINAESQGEMVFGPTEDQPNDLTNATEKTFEETQRMIAQRVTDCWLVLLGWARLRDPRTTQ